MLINPGAIASTDLLLNEINSFYTDDGAFFLDAPQKLTITQGDGQTTSVTLYGSDTLGEVVNKLNEAIAYGLGQAKYLEGNEDAGHFAVYVPDDEDTEGTQEGMSGSIVIRSAMTGRAGTLRFSGSEELMTNLGLNTIQEAQDNEFTVTVRRSDTKETITSGTQTTGSRITGAISPNIDIVFDNMAGISASWNDNTKAFTFGTYSCSTVIHLKDNSSNLQVGAKENERINFTIADVSTKGLNLDAADIADRESAGKTISTIDNAIDKLSTQNAKTGAMINRLEESIEVISVMHENSTESESKIRDADMAKATMTLTRLQMMLNAQSSVLSQSNQTANNVLSILR